MRFLVVCRARPGVTREQIAPHGPEEMAALHSLKAAGGLLEAYSPGGPGAVLIFEGERDLCCRAVMRGMVERGRGRIVNMGSGASYLPPSPSGIPSTAYGPSKAAVGRFGEVLAHQAAPQGVAVFTISPGLVRTAMTEGFGEGAPWTPPELAPRLIRVLVSGRADRLAGRYLHAEHDDIEQLIADADHVVEHDRNAIRLQR